MSTRNSSMQQLSLAEKRHYLQNLLAGAKRLHASASGRVVATLSTLLAGLDDGDEVKKAAIAERDKKRAELYTRAYNGDAEAKAGIAVMRVQTVDNFLTAKSNVMKFFKMVPLQPNELPYFENTTRQYIIVSYLGTDGRARRTQAIKSWDRQSFGLHMISTEEFEYPLWDLNTGMVADDAKATIDMADDMDRTIDSKAWPFLDRMCGAFSLTGSSPLRTYVAHPTINVKNLPKTNLLIPAGNTSTTKWRKECMDAVIGYCQSWADVLPGGQIKPVTVFIPSSETTGYLEQIQLTSFGNALVEQIMDDGWVIKYGGLEWNIQGDATLDPDKGRAYIQTSQPVGEFYTKPALDRTFDDQSILLQKQNKGVISMQKAIGFGIPNVWAPNVICVQYHDPR